MSPILDGLSFPGTTAYDIEKAFDSVEFPVLRLTYMNWVLMENADTQMYEAPTSREKHVYQIPFLISKTRVCS